MQRLALAFGGACLGTVLQGCGGGGHSGGDHPPTPTLPKSCATTTTTTTPAGANWTGYSCSSTRQLKSKVKAASKKGFAVDDPTLATCSEELVAHWPHCPEQEKVNSLRLFSAWKEWWNEDEKMTAWHNIKTFLEHNDAKVLLGLDMLCEPKNDKWEFDQAFSLMKFLGKDLIMGLAFGNEMDNKDKCREGFKSGDFFNQIKSWVQTMDDEGFEKVPVTVVWSMGVLGKDNDPAKDPFDPELEGFLQAAHDQWGMRFIWTFNPYPLWDPSIIPSKKDDNCADMIKAATGDYTRNVMGACRGRVTNFTKTEDSVIWAGESGWSSPFVSAQKHIKSFCPEWGSEETLFKFYETMMDWDLSLPDDVVTGKPVRGIDHLFFFTMRDFNGESFGLVEQCCASECKIQLRTTTPVSSTTSELGSAFLADVVV